MSQYHIKLLLMHLNDIRRYGRVLSVAFLLFLPHIVLSAEEDVTFQAVLNKVAEEFLHRHSLQNVGCCVYVKTKGSAQWVNASVNGDQYFYPACCAKLGFLPFLVSKATKMNYDMQQFSSAIMPMYRDSDNYIGGVVVDWATGVSNYDVISHPELSYESWLSKRMVFEDYLEQHGLLQGQRLFTKTYPTNSGELPVGAEGVAWRQLGSNRMTPNASAELLRRIVEGSIESTSKATMLSLLKRERVYKTSALGFGLPPGSYYFSKCGAGNSTVADIAYVVLPNETELVLAVFSDGRTEPYRSAEACGYDMAILGDFMLSLLQSSNLGSDLHMPIEALVDEYCIEQGNWKFDSTTSSLNERYLVATTLTTPSLSLDCQITTAGLYEVWIKYAPVSKSSSRVKLSILQDSRMLSSHIINQQCGGDLWVRVSDKQPLQIGPVTVSVESDLSKELSYVSCYGIRFWMCE